MRGEILENLDFCGFRGFADFSNFFLGFSAFPLCPKCSWTFWHHFCNNRCSKLLSGVQIGSFFVFFRPFFDHGWGTTSPLLRVPQKTAPFFPPLFRGLDFPGLRAGGHPDGNIFEKRDPFFPGALIKPTFESGFNHKLVLLTPYRD